MLTYQKHNTTKTLKALSSGELSFKEYLEEVEAHFNSREPSVLAFLPEDGRFRRLQSDAEALIEKYPNPGQRLALFGMLIGVKDIFHVSGFETHAGSNLPAEILQGEEAVSVTILKNAGALILGKTVTTEFAYFAPGPTMNPHNPEHTPGGSSSGSAAAVGAGIVPLALGTQTIGSITRPASYCGVFGYKPTYDRISKAGVIPLASSVDHVGVLTSNLALAKLAASLLCNNWTENISSSAKPILGIPEGSYLEKALPEMQIHYERTISLLREAGYEIKAAHVMPDFENITTRHNVIVAAEAYKTHQAWFTEYGERYHEKTTELIQRGKEITPQELSLALDGRKQLRAHLDSAMKDHGIDLWISPSATGPAPKGLASTGDPIMNLPWTHSGLPTLNIPSGKNDAGLPLGLQVAAGWNQDELLFEFSKGIAEILN